MRGTLNTLIGATPPRLFLRRPPVVLAAGAAGTAAGAAGAAAGFSSFESLPPIIY